MRESNSRWIAPDAFSKRTRQTNIRLLSIDDLGGTRTRNLLLRKQMLYPLSYEVSIPAMRLELTFLRFRKATRVLLRYAGVPLTGLEPAFCNLEGCRSSN